MMGKPASLGTIEGLLLLSEFLPRVDSSGPNVDAGEEEKRMSWMLVGTAVRLGYLMGLDQKTFIPIAPSATTRMVAMGKEEEILHRERLVWTCMFSSSTLREIWLDFCRLLHVRPTSIDPPREGILEPRTWIVLSAGKTPLSLGVLHLNASSLFPVRRLDIFAVHQFPKSSPHCRNWWDWWPGRLCEPGPSVRSISRAVSFTVSFSAYAHIPLSTDTWS